MRSNCLANVYKSSNTYTQKWCIRLVFLYCPSTINHCISIECVKIIRWKIWSSILPTMWNRKIGPQTNSLDIRIVANCTGLIVYICSHKHVSAQMVKKNTPNHTKWHTHTHFTAKSIALIMDYGGKSMQIRFFTKFTRRNKKSHTFLRLQTFSHATIPIKIH